jgi:hypothetical protein
MLVRLAKAHRVDSPLSVLTAVNHDDYGESDTPLELKWDQLGSIETWAPRSLRVQNPFVPLALVAPEWRLSGIR